MVWDESKHPRVPGGKSSGGQWTKDGSIAGTAARKASGTLPSKVKYGVHTSPDKWWAIKDGVVFQSNAHSIYDEGHAGIAKKLKLETTDEFDVRGYSGTIRKGAPGEGTPILVFYDVSSKSRSFLNKHLKLLEKRLKLPGGVVIYVTENISEAYLWDGS